MVQLIKRKVLGSLRSKITDEKYGVVIEISKKEKALYVYDLNSEVAVKTILKSASSDLWKKIADYFNINPFDYNVECTDCDKKIKKKVIELVGREEQMREKLPQKTRKDFIKALIKKDKEDEAIRQLLFAFRHLVDDSLTLRIEGGAKNRLQEMKLEKWNEEYRMFHSDKALNEFVMLKLISTDFIDAITNKDVNREIKSLNKICKSFHETVEQSYK